MNDHDLSELFDSLAGTIGDPVDLPTLHRRIRSDRQRSGALKVGIAGVGAAALVGGLFVLRTDRPAAPQGAASQPKPTAAPKPLPANCAVAGVGATATAVFVDPVPGSNVTSKGYGTVTAVDGTTGVTITTTMLSSVSFSTAGDGTASAKASTKSASAEPVKLPPTAGTVVVTDSGAAAAPVGVPTTVTLTIDAKTQWMDGDAKVNQAQPLSVGQFVMFGAEGTSKDSLRAVVIGVNPVTPTFTAEAGVPAIASASTGTGPKGGSGSVTVDSINVGVLVSVPIEGSVVLQAGTSGGTGAGLPAGGTAVVITNDGIVPAAATAVGAKTAGTVTAMDGTTLTIHLDDAAATDATIKVSTSDTTAYISGVPCTAPAPATKVTAGMHVGVLYHVGADGANVADAVILNS